MPIRRPAYMVMKAGKKGNIRLAFESEHLHKAEDYIRQWGGILVVGQLEETDVEIGSNPDQHPRRRGEPPVMTEPYIAHEGAVPPPPGTVAPFLVPYGQDMTRVFVSIERDEDDSEERVVHLNESALADVLAALEQASEPEDSDGFPA
jgi:hypothetical protein